jgi:hypothetical protein
VPIGRRPAFGVEGVGLVYEPPIVALSLGIGLALTIL